MNYQHSKQKELNKFIQLKTKFKIEMTHIKFLSLCKEHKVFPKFMIITTPVRNSRSSKVLTIAKKIWLREEINYHYYRLNELELAIYELHLNLSNDFLYHDEWNFFNDRVDSIIEAKISSKIVIHQQKLRSLILEKQS